MGVFFAVSLLGMPLAFALGTAAAAGLAVGSVPFNMLPTRMVNALDSFPLLSIPLFMAAGELMINWPRARVNAVPTAAARRFHRRMGPPSVCLSGTSDTTVSSPNEK